MPFLNWRDAQLFLKQEEQVEHSKQISLLTLRVPPDLLGSLVQDLEDVFSSEGIELRIALPSLSDAQWVLFWKVRPGDSRALLAHPSPQEWVGTVALEVEFGKRLIFSLKNLAAGQSLKLSEIGALNTLSNLELVIQAE